MIHEKILLFTNNTHDYSVFQTILTHCGKKAKKNDTIMTLK